MHPRRASRADPDASRCASPRPRTCSVATSDAAARETGKFFLDPGLEYPGATREQLVEAGDWFMPSGSEFLAPQLGFPEKLFEWRTEANAAKLWSTSQEMVSKYTV